MFVGVVCMNLVIVVVVSGFVFQWFIEWFVFDDVVVVFLGVCDGE